MMHRNQRTRRERSKLIRVDVKIEGAVEEEEGVDSEVVIGVDVAEEEVSKLSLEGKAYGGGQVDEEKSGVRTTWLL